jgi:competence protein ComEC
MHMTSRRRRFANSTPSRSPQTSWYSWDETLTMLDRLKTFCLFNPCFLLALGASAVLGSCHEVNRPQVPLKDDRLTQVEGWISRPPQVLDDHIYLELSPLLVQQQEESIAYPGRLAVYISSSHPDPETYFDPPLGYGEILALNSFLEDPSYYEIPGVADFRQVLWTQGLLHRIRLKSPLQVERKGRHPMGRFLGPLFGYAQKFHTFAHNHLSTDALKLVRSVFLGQRKTLEATDQALLKRLGIFHLFVVSGFHVSIIVLFLHWQFHRWGLLGRILTLAGLWTYVILVGAGLPTLRAGIMMTLFYLLLGFGLSRQFLNALGLSALILLAASPDVLFSSGFQFSYLSLCAIGLFVLPYQARLQSLYRGFQDAFTETVSVDRAARSKLQRRVRFLLEEKLYFWPRPGIVLLSPLGWVLSYFLGLAMCGLVIQFFTLPVTLYYTNRWVWTQWGINFLLVPFFTLFVPACLILFLTFYLPTGPLFAQLVGTYAEGLLHLMTSLQSLSWITYVRQPEASEILIYFLIFLSAYFFLPGKVRLSILLAPLWLWLVVQQSPAHPQEKLVITMLDVGQGESLHIRYPNGKDALIDTGGLFSSPDEDNPFVGERLVSRYLWAEQSQELDYVLLTHPDADHIQGYGFIRKAFPIGRLLFHDFPRQAFGTARQHLQEGDRFSIAGVDHRVLHPPSQNPVGSRWNTNNNSLVVQLQYKNFKILFTGDIERAAERYLVSKLNPVTVLKAAHHGARTSNTRPLLEKTQPRLAVISAGRKNFFGHPSNDTLERFSEAGIPVLTTSEWGSLRIETDGIQWQVFHYSPQEETFQEIKLRKY